MALGITIGNTLEALGGAYLLKRYFRFQNPIGRIQASPTQQAEMDFATIDTYVTEQMNNLGIPGMALGIFQDGQIVHLQGLGIAVSSGRKITPHAGQLNV